jgi:hypothetical protein
MKTLLLSLILLSSFNAQAQSLPSCLDLAKKWIYANTSGGSSEAAEKAMAFCSQGGKASCLDGAKTWIYSNTSGGSSEAANKAIHYCSRGADPSCLEPTKKWIYANTSGGSSEAAEKAIEVCRGQVRCESSSGFSAISKAIK